MINLNYKLKKLEEEHKPILTGIIGAGQMGKALVSQFTHLKGMRPSVVCAAHLEHVLTAFDIAGIPRDMLRTVKNGDEAAAAVEAGKYAVCDDFSVVNGCGLLDCVIDATGNTDAGAGIAMGAIENGHDVIMLNVETDVTVGHILKHEAERAGVIYTASAGDEPGAVKELYDFAEAIGLDILVMGKGKNNKVDLECNPDTVREEALARGMAPKMLSSFKDGTKTMVEMTCMSNSTGFLPDVRGAHGPKVNTTNACDILRLKSEGGILNNYKVVEYTDGLAPGVFLIVTSGLEQVHAEMQYLKIGSGPNYLIYRPYHLCSLETPITVARAKLMREPSLLELTDTPFSETVTVAKKDLSPGEYIDGIGGFCVYGAIERYETARRENLTPIGMINTATRVVKPVKKGQAVSRDALAFDENSPVYRLRRRQEELLG